MGDAAPGGPDDDARSRDRGQDPVVRDAGDAALVLEFGTRIDPAVAARVARLDRRIAALVANGSLLGIVETVPTFRSLAVLIDPRTTDPATVAARVLEDWRTSNGSESADATDAGTARTWTLPVRYGGEHGPDLAEVAARTGLSPGDVVGLHAGTPVRVYMLGFLPGYAFLGDTDARLHLPRRTEPRTRVPAGSVAVATSLTGVYPVESPGGWHLIGHCPVPLFDAAASPPALLAPGDAVRFRAVDADEHEAIAGRVAAGAFDARELLIDASESAAAPSDGVREDGS